MNFGTHDIEQVIWKQINQGVTVQCKGGSKKFVKDLAKQLYSFLEANLDDLHIIAKARGFDDAAVKMRDRVCKAFNFYSLPLRNEQDAEVYLWIAEREKEGQKIEQFVRWAKGDDRSQYIRMYFKDLQNIRLDWDRAFPKIDEGLDVRI